MGLLKKLFGPKPTSETSKPDVADGAEQEPRKREGPVFGAWTSCDLERMLAVVDEPCHPVDRHFLLMNIVSETYKRRKDDPSSRDLCARFSRRHLAEFSSLVEPLRREMEGQLPRVPTFQHLATLLVETGDYSGAVEVCTLALKYGLHDGTKGGFEGRIARIRRKGGLE